MEREKLLFVNEAAAVGASWEQQLNNGFLNPSNWDNSMDQSDPFESALSSIVSSPVAQQPSTNATPIPPHGDTFMIRELIGRLGSICNSGGVGVVVDDSISLSPQSYLQQHQTQHHHHNHHNNNNNTTTSSTNNSCYTTPISSPPKHNLSMVDPHHNIRALAAAATHHNLAPLAAADPGFAERAARLSCFGSRSTLHLNNTTTMNRSSSSSCLETNKLYRLAAGSQMKQQQETNNIQDGDSKESSSVSEPQTQSQNDASSSRKRKSVPRTKAKDTTTTTKTPSSTNDAKVVTENEESNRTKRSKQEEAESNGNENDSGKAKSGGVDGNQKQNNNNNNKDNSKPPEPPKDYIHVRARRGQATDSHSLAERVRREKISERMKFLQDLVPGCNKVTGKAVMLDEIINYVQSLQRQVEFLSMKLATVNPRMDFNVEALLSKDMFQSRGALQNAVYQVDSSASTFPFGYQPQAGLQPLNGGSMPNNADTQFSINNSSSSNHPLDSAAAAALHRNPNLQLPSSNGYGETPAQAPSFWEDDLQSLVQMGFNQNQPQSFHGSSVTTAQMKIEL